MVTCCPWGGAAQIQCGEICGCENRCSSGQEVKGPIEEVGVSWCESFLKLDVLPKTTRTGVVVCVLVFWTNLITKVLCKNMHLLVVPGKIL